MRINCPNPECGLPKNLGPKSKSIVRKGFFFRKSDSRKIRRFLCQNCKTQFSAASLSPKRYQKVRRINPALRKLLVSGVSQRRAAILLNVNRKTVVRRFRFLAMEAKRDQDLYLKSLHGVSLKEIQFDDLETSEQTKCKPLSVALAVEPRSRKILGFQVSQMPAKGRLAKIAIRKYGYRKDERAKGWDQLLKDLKPLVDTRAVFTSDENPHYPRFLFKHHPDCSHIKVPGGRGAITGQGELKKKKFDPIFSLNHTCAMMRANLNRLFRRTWCTTKRREDLIHHLFLYMSYHNRVLTKAYPILGAS